MSSLGSSPANGSHNSAEASTPNAASHFWTAPWGYPHAILVTATLFLNGWLLHLAFGATAVKVPAWPFNFYALAVLWTALFATSWKWRNTAFVTWLSGIPVSVVSLAFVSVLSLLAGIIPQGGEHWITNITGSWPFAFVLVFMLVNLGLATLRRLFQFRLSDSGFVANHLGFWIVVAGMAFGSSDIEKLRMTVGENETSTQAQRMDASAGRKAVEVPFAIALKEFRMDDYHPRLAFYDANSANFEMKVLSSNLTPKSIFNVGDLVFTVDNVIPAAKRTSSGFEPSTEKFSEFALYASVLNTKTKELKTSWMAPGAENRSPVTIHTPSGIFVLLDPQAKLYRSTIEISAPGVSPRAAQVEVNKPLSFLGWKIYQSAYEVSANRTKYMSVFDLVRDPWLPVVYAGAILMLIGTCHLFWNGVKRHGTAHKDNLT